MHRERSCSLVVTIAFNNVMLLMVGDVPIVFEDAYKGMVCVHACRVRALCHPLCVVSSPACHASTADNSAFHYYIEDSARWCPFINQGDHTGRPLSLIGGRSSDHLD